MREPQLSYFPVDEYVERLKSIRRLMDESSIDALLLGREDNVTYTTGLLNQYWVATLHDDVQLALITGDPDKECALLVPGHLYITSKTSWVEDVRCWSQYGIAHSRGAVETAVSTLKDKGLERSRIGMEIGSDDRLPMSLPLFEELRAKLPKAEFVGCFDIIKEVRAVKSEREIRCLRRATEITCKGFRAGLEALREGMSEEELAHIICSAMLEDSPELAVYRPWVVFVHSDGHGAAWFDGTPSDYRFKKGDCVYIDGGAVFKGYHSDIIRCASIGKPAPEKARLYEGARKANMAAMAEMRPGVKCSQLYTLWADTVRKLGFGQQLDMQLSAGFDFLGHGIGLSVHERPLLTSKVEDKLQEGMVISLEGNVLDKMPFSEAQICLKNEEDVLVTKDGYEWLTPLENHLWIK